MIQKRQKYQGAFRQELNEPIEEDVVQEEDNAPAANREEETWKKRHGDLRRHQQQKEKELGDRIALLETQLADASKAQIKYPKSEQEVTAWMEKYPDVSKIVQSIAMKANEDTREEFTNKFTNLKKLEEKVAEREAVAELLRLHPDFDELRQTDEFLDWLDGFEDDHWVIEALYNNKTDSKYASRAIQFFKDTHPKSTKTEKPKTNPKEAAFATPRSNASAPSNGSKTKFSESMIQNNSTEWFEKNEDAILDSMHKGEFEYDLTGGAR